MDLEREQRCRPVPRSPPRRYGVGDREIDVGECPLVLIAFHCSPAHRSFAHTSSASTAWWPMRRWPAGAQSRLWCRRNRTFAATLPWTSLTLRRCPACARPHLPAFIATTAVAITSGYGDEPVGPPQVARAHGNPRQGNRSLPDRTRPQSRLAAGLRRRTPLPAAWPGC
jgi:hypothetical protein